VEASGKIILIPRVALRPRSLSNRVITLNVLSVGQAVSDLMMMFTGLFDETVNLGHQMNFVANERCLDCGTGIQPI